MTKQLTIFDRRGVVEATFAVALEPMSVRELVDNLPQDADPYAPLGSQVSGCQREKMGAEVEEALREFYYAAWALYDEQRAAVLLLKMCARDAAYEPPEWLRELWALYRDELRAEFHGTADDGRTDWGEGRHEEEDEDE